MEETTLENKCEYCGKVFKKQQTLFVHVCEQKRRALAKHDKHVVIGYTAFTQFYKYQFSSTQKTYDEFCKSKYYNGFVKFGSFVNNVKPLYPDNFITYVINSGIKIDDWCKDELYDKYVVELIKTENVDTALTRSIKYMIEWGDKNNQEWNQYFSLVSLPRATYDIKDGKISPWIILNSQSGKELVKKFNDEQLNSISLVIDPLYWVNKFKRYPSDVTFAKQLIKESNI